MTDDAVPLDEHRGMAAQKATESRRENLEGFKVAEEALQRRQDELEKHLAAATAATWPEAAAKAEYLIRLFADTPEGRDPRRQKLIAQTLDDLRRLTDRAEED